MRAQGKVLRQNKEERLATEWMNNATLQLSNATDEAGLDLAFTSNENDWLKSKRGGFTRVSIHLGI